MSAASGFIRLFVLIYAIVSADFCEALSLPATTTFASSADLSVVVYNEDAPTFVNKNDTVIGSKQNQQYVETSDDKANVSPTLVTYSLGLQCHQCRPDEDENKCLQFASPTTTEAKSDLPTSERGSGDDNDAIAGSNGRQTAVVCRACEYTAVAYKLQLPPLPHNFNQNRRYFSSNDTSPAAMFAAQQQQQRHVMQYNCITQEMLDSIQLLRELVDELTHHHHNSSSNNKQTSAVESINHDRTMINNINDFHVTQQQQHSDISTDNSSAVRNGICRYGGSAYVDYQSQAYEYMIRNVQQQPQHQTDQQQIVQSIRHFRDAVVQTLQQSVDDAVVCLCDDADFCNLKYAIAGRNASA